MTPSRPSWVETIHGTAERAPDWMRACASTELHIGGFTQAQLDTPVLDLASIAEPEHVTRALTFFLIVALAAGASVARVQCATHRGDELAREAEQILGDACARLDAENVRLMRYFDVFFPSSSAIPDAHGQALADALAAVV